jgi:hypothetical protein
VSLFPTFGDDDGGDANPSATVDQGHSATLLLRNTSIFDNDERMQPHVESGRAQLVQGDALVQDDVKTVWEKATDYGRAVDYVVFTIGKLGFTKSLCGWASSPPTSFAGATPDMSSFKLTKGFTINPPNITTKAILNVLCTMPNSDPRPKIIAATSIGVTKDSPLPLVYKPLYGYLLREPHADKLGLERILAHGSGRTWDDKEPRAEMTTVDGVRWQDRKGLPASGSVETLVLRLPIFVGGDSKRAPSPSKTKAGVSSPPPTAEGEPEVKKDEEEKQKYRVGGGELSGTYTISREEVAHFIAETAVKRWEEFKGKAVTLSR